MGMQDAVRSFISRYSDFQGRSSRSEYWWVYLALILVQIAAMIVIGILASIADFLGMIGYLALGIAGLAVLVPSIALAFRRMHDLDKSAWWLLISLIPLIGAIWLLVLLVTKGTTGPNRFGPDPLEGETAPAPAAA